MAKVGLVDSDGNVQYVTLADPNATKVTPEESFNNLVDNQDKITEIIDVEAETINDSGYVDLSQLSALKNVNPDTPGEFIHTSKAVTFTEDEKTNLQLLIKKLAEVAHTHDITDNDLSSSNVSYDCSNQKCIYCSQNSNNQHNTNNGDNGWYW